MPIDVKDSTIALAVKASDVEQALNQQTLKVSGLGAAKYALKIDGESVAELTKDELAAGVNLAEFDTPMFRQAKAVHELTLRHNDLHFQRWRTSRSLTSAGGIRAWQRRSRVSMLSKPIWSPSSEPRRSRCPTGSSWSPARDRVAAVHESDGARPEFGTADRVTGQAHRRAGGAAHASRVPTRTGW